MYNPYQAPGQYGTGAYAGIPGAPPGIAPPPGIGAPPGTSAPPGIQQPELEQGRQGGFPPNFQPPANLPNINFSAPVIRLGTSQLAKPDLMGAREERAGGDRGGGGGGRRAGLGSGPDRGRDEGRVQQVQPQTKEEIIKTIFIGGITEGCGGDEGIERILRAAGSLRRWIRATDADDKPCKFGFAEYEDAESLATAIETLKEIDVPVKRQAPKDSEAEHSESAEVEKSRLLVVADENSTTYLEQYKEQQGEVDPDARQMRLDHAKEALAAVLHDLTYPSAPTQKDELSHIDNDSDAIMNGTNTTTDANGEVITIPITTTADDELSDIPAEMRETVAKEIAAFRDRSNRRDLERLKREDEIEAQERNRMLNGSGNARPSRLASPPLSAPAGPGGANGIPVGPRERSAVVNAPSGPKGFPRDYAKGVAFITGTGSITAASAFEDSDTDASDSELEKRCKAKSNADAEKSFLDQERRWLNRERSRAAAIEREKQRDAEEDGRLQDARAAMAKQLREWDDDREADRKIQEYYADRSMWIRNRTAFRQREVAADDADRERERRERGDRVDERDRNGTEPGKASRNRDVEMHDADRESLHHHPDRPVPESAAPSRFQMKLGAKVQEARERATAKETRRTTAAAEVEGFLEDEEADSANRAKRTLVPIQFDKNDTATMTEEERRDAAKQLAGEIPSDLASLSAWPVKWDHIDESIITERLRPFIEKKIVEYLGVQEDMLVDVVVSALQARKGAGAIKEELEGALGEEEAEGLVRKVWRMVVFWGESEAKGLNV
ncbi:hypothetical protein DV735_g5678, partial [Chaetothyriales sp. CBS 134920]